MADNFVSIVDNTLKAFELIDKAKVRGLEAIGATAEKYAKEECPVDTGRLRSSISHAVINEEYTIIGTNVEYAQYVEFDDTKKHTSGKAHFLRDAALNHSDEYQSLMKESIRNA